MKFWHEWQGSSEGEITMLIRHIFSFMGYKLDLHKFIAADQATCFHTHPANAIRLIIWGGYTEQIQHDSQYFPNAYFYTKKQWIVGDIGLIKPGLCHRIDTIRRKVSYSLWFRFPKTHDIKIFGEC